MRPAAVLVMINVLLVHLVGNWQLGNVGRIVLRVSTRRIMGVKNAIIRVGIVQVIFRKCFKEIILGYTKF